MVQGRCVWAAVGALILAVMFVFPAYTAEKRPSDRPVGSTTLRPAVPLDSWAMKAMLRADGDKDGVLTREELEHYDVTVARRFSEGDADGDGRLTLFEFEKIFMAPGTSASRP